MRFCTALATVMVAVLSTVQTSAAAPAVAGYIQAPAPEHEVPCESVNKYTTEWFYENVLSDFGDHIIDTALFYSRGMSTPARNFAWKKGLVTIWDVWPCYLYIHRNTPDNPMRCIHHDEQQRTIFYENMSCAFAKKASKSATVMHSFDDYENPPLTGIWGRIEFETVQSDTDVEWLWKLNEDASLCKIFWKRLRETIVRHLGWLSSLPSSYLKTDMKKRASSDVLYCMSPLEYSFFDNVDW